MNRRKDLWLGVMLVVTGLIAGVTFGTQAQVQAGNDGSPPLSHFQCYRISATDDLPHRVRLVDQFGEHGTTVGRGVMLCAPVTKKVTHGRVTTDTGPHLTCYAVDPTADKNINFEFRNQFHTFIRRELHSARLLCVPTERGTL